MRKPTQGLSDNFSKGFSLVELLVSMTISGVIVAVLGSMLGRASDSWVRGEKRGESFSNGRTTLEWMGREAKGALASSRTQFGIARGDLLSDSPPEGTTFETLDLAQHIAPGSHAAFWVTPVDSYGDLAEVGYYLHRDEAKKQFWLKRLYISQSAHPEALFPLIELVDGDGEYNEAFVREGEDPMGIYRPSPVACGWLFHRLDEEVHQLEGTDVFDDLNPAEDHQSYVSTLASGVVAFWVQAFDQQGNPIPALDSYPGFHDAPVHPIIYNSASYFVQANMGTFDGTRTFSYTAAMISTKDNRVRALRANRVPAAIEFTLITVDQRSLQEVDGSSIPEQEDITMDGANGTVLDIVESTERFTTALQEVGVNEYRVFSTRVKLQNGGK